MGKIKRTSKLTLNLISVKVRFLYSKCQRRCLFFPIYHLLAIFEEKKKQIPVPIVPIKMDEPDSLLSADG